MPTEYNDMQLLKRRLFAMRNGVIADVLRRAGSPYAVIFGVNLPQLVEIAANAPHTREMAEKLWANSTTRESMLIAPMLMPREEFSKADALRWISEIKSAEAADVLCLKLLRHEPYALELAQELLASDSHMLRYAGIKLMSNIVGQYPAEAEAAARRELERGCAYTRQAASILLSNFDQS